MWRAHTISNLSQSRRDLEHPSRLVQAPASAPGSADIPAACCWVQEGWAFCPSH